MGILLVTKQMSIKSVYSNSQLKNNINLFLITDSTTAMILRIISVVLLITIVNTAPQKETKDGSFKMIILHNNDMHARFEQTGMFSDKCKKDAAANNKCYGGFARVAHEVREYRRKADNNEIPPVLYLNAGDTYTGTPWFSLYKNNITADFLNILKPDAIVSN